VLNIIFKKITQLRSTQPVTGIIIIVLLLLLLLLTAIKLSLDGNNPYTSTYKTNKKKYT
jgi:hypothetical protein